MCDDRHARVGYLQVTFGSGSYFTVRVPRDDFACLGVGDDTRIRRRESAASIRRNTVVTPGRTSFGGSVKAKRSPVIDWTSRVLVLQNRTMIDDGVHDVSITRCHLRGVVAEHQVDGALEDRRLARLWVARDVIAVLGVGDVPEASEVGRVVQRGGEPRDPAADGLRRVAVVDDRRRHIACAEPRGPVKLLSENLWPGLTISPSTVAATRRMFSPDSSEKPRWCSR